MALISPANQPPYCLPAETDWDNVEHLSRIWHVAPTLWLALRRDPQLANQPAVRVARLRQGYVENLRRNRLIRQDIIRISKQLNAAGFVPLLLKGAATLFDPMTIDPGERYMHDFDFMVEAKRDEVCFRYLSETGFEANLTSQSRPQDRRHHWPPLIDPVSGLELELHWRPYVFASDAVVEAFHEDAQIVEANGARMRIPADHHRISHNVFHAQISDDGLSHAYFNPKYLLEFANFCQQMPEAAFVRASAYFGFLSTAYLSWINLCQVYLAVMPPGCPKVRILDKLQAMRIERRSTFGQRSNIIETAGRVFIRTRAKIHHRWSRF